MANDEDLARIRQGPAAKKACVISPSKVRRWRGRQDPRRLSEDSFSGGPSYSRIRDCDIHRLRAGRIGAGADADGRVAVALSAVQPLRIFPGTSVSVEKSQFAEKSEASHSRSAAQSLDMACKTRPAPKLPMATIAGVLSHTMTIAGPSNIAYILPPRRNHRLPLLVLWWIKPFISD
jgi:hypothetical protein